MRPRSKYSAPDVRIVREQACFKLWKPLFRALEPGPSNANRFAEANPIRSFFLIPKGKGISVCLQNFTLEISLSKQPANSCRICLLKRAPFNQQAWSKTAKQDALADSRLSRWLLPKKRRPLLTSSMAKILAGAL